MEAEITTESVVNEIDLLISRLRTGLGTALDNPDKTLQRLDDLMRSQLPQVMMIKRDIETLRGYRSPIYRAEIPIEEDDDDTRIY